MDGLESPAKRVSGCRFELQHISTHHKMRSVGESLTKFKKRDESAQLLYHVANRVIKFIFITKNKPFNNSFSLY